MPLPARHKIAYYPNYTYSVNRNGREIAIEMVYMQANAQHKECVVCHEYYYPRNTDRPTRMFENPSYRFYTDDPYICGDCQWENNNSQRESLPAEEMRGEMGVTPLPIDIEALPLAPVSSATSDSHFSHFSGGSTEWNNIDWSTVSRMFADSSSLPLRSWQPTAYNTENNTV